MSAPDGSQGPPPGAPPMPPMVQIGQAYGGRGPALMGTIWSFMAFTTVLVIGRIHVRTKRQLRTEETSDLALWLALLAWVTAVISAVFVTVSVAHGYGNHIYLLSFPNIVEALKYNWLGISFAAFSSGVAKSSVAAFLLVMQNKSAYHKKFKWFLWFMLVSNFLIHAITPFIIMFQCTPAAAAWDMRLQATADCTIQRTAFGDWGMFQSAYSAASDLLLALYPILIVFKLQISTRLKLLICGLLGLGVIAAVFSFIRLAVLRQTIVNPPQDPTHEVAILTIWGHVELWVVLIALSIPPIWPLLKPFVQEVTTRVVGSHRSHTWSGNSSGRKPGSGNEKHDAWVPMGSGSNSGSIRSRDSTTFGGVASVYSPRQSGVTMPPAISSEQRWSTRGVGGIQATRDITVTSESQTDLRPPPAGMVYPGRF